MYVLLLLDGVVCDVIWVLLVFGFVQFLSTQLHCPSSCTDYLLLIIKSVEISRENCEFSYFSFQFRQFLLSSI